MRHLKRIHGLAFLACFIAATSTGYGRDITIFDQKVPSSGSDAWYFGSSDLETHPVPPSYGLPVDREVREDNETEPTTIKNQAWDLEAIELQGTTLTIVGGYQWNKGTKSNATTTSAVNDPDYFYPGDIFIDVDGFPNPVAGGTAFAPVANPGFDYVITFDAYERGTGAGNAQGHIGSGGYTIKKIDGSAALVSSQYLSSSNPFRWVSGQVGADLGTGTASFSGPHNDSDASDFINADNPLSLSDRSLLGGDHYYLSLDITDLLDALGAGETFGAHITMGCGNDEIVGWLPPSARVPDGGASLGLLGLSLLTTHFLRKKLVR